MTKHLMSFASVAVVLSGGERQAVSDTAHAVVQEAGNLGVRMLGGGMDESVLPVLVDGDGTVTTGTSPQTQQLDGGFAVPALTTREAALDRVAQLASACRCAGHVRPVGNATAGWRTPSEEGRPRSCRPGAPSSCPAGTPMLRPVTRTFGRVRAGSGQERVGRLRSGPVRPGVRLRCPSAVRPPPPQKRQAGPRRAPRCRRACAGRVDLGHARARVRHRPARRRTASDGEEPFRRQHTVLAAVGRRARPATDIGQGRVSQGEASQGVVPPGRRHRMHVRGGAHPGRSVRRRCRARSPATTVPPVSTARPATGAAAPQPASRRHGSGWRASTGWAADRCPPGCPTSAAARNRRGPRSEAARGPSQNDPAATHGTRPVPPEAAVRGGR